MLFVVVGKSILIVVYLRYLIIELCYLFLNRDKYSFRFGKFFFDLVNTRGQSILFQLCLLQFGVVFVYILSELIS